MKPTPRNVAISRVASMLERLVSDGRYSEDDAELVVRAATHAVDPWFAEGFAVAVGHHDPDTVPMAATLEMLIEERMAFSLLWTPEKWVAKHEQLTRARELRRQANDYAMRAKWLEWFLESDGWDRRRVQVVTNPQRLVREALRQRIGITSVVKGLERGRLACASVLVDGKRWTVLLRPRSRWRRRGVRITSIQGRDAITPDEQARRSIVEVLGLPPPHARRRAQWPGWGPLAVAGMGLLTARWVALIEPSAPRIPELLLASVGVSVFVASRYLTRRGRRASRISNGLFAVTWLAPPALGMFVLVNPIPVFFPDLAEASGLTSQLMLVPACYVAAALAWPLVAKMMGERRTRTKTAVISVPRTSDRT